MEEPLLTRQVLVNNELGLHTRPATSIVKLLQQTKSEVFLPTKKETINAKSILGILILAVPKNGIVTVQIKGEDAQATMDLLIASFANCFGEKL